ncbi:ABC transporter substrate-binding protein [Xanthobacter sp. DSM 24535]|uniref:ABC transporter substrate-binding protein n=1 Tax=Roseixanthobacter psychrophilus TaxID=3119917 RepID=UPI003729C6BF
MLGKYVKAAVVAGGLVSALAGAPAAYAADSKDPIIIALHDWTGQAITSHIAGEIVKSKGDKVEYVTIDYLTGLTAMENGDITFMSELWATTAGDAMKASDATGKTENLGPLGPKAKEEWWYPMYMKEKCPGLPDWHALLKCGEAFAVPETAPKGRYLGMEATWGGHDPERIKALKLPFVAVDAGTEAAMFAELKSAYERKAPIILWVYSPHWVPSVFEGEWVQFPEYTDACYTDPKWGVNPDLAFDCGKPHGDIFKYISAKAKTKWPEAYKALKDFKVDGPELNLMVKAVDVDGKSIDDVVAKWMADHKGQY